MEKQDLKLLRSFLFRTFVVGFLFALLMFLLTLGFWDKWSSLVFSKFQVSPKELGEMFVRSMIYIRFYLVFIILVPAIALHWLIKKI